MRARMRSLRTDTGRLRTPWRLLVAGILFLSVNVVLTVGFLAAGVAVDPREAMGAELAGVFVVVIGNGIAISLATVVAARRLDRRLLSDIGVSVTGLWWRDLAVGLAVGAALVVGAYLVGIAVGVYDPTVDPSGPAGHSLPVWLGLLTAAMVAIGVYEELLLRGYVLTNVAEGLTAFVGLRAAVVGALALSSAGFGLLHGANPNATALGVLTITLAGVFLGLGYVYTGSLAFPIGAHITWNLTHVLVGVPVSGLDFGIRLLHTDVSGPRLIHGGGFGPEGGLLGVGMTVVGCLLAVGYGRWTGRGLDKEIAVPSLRKT